MTLVSYIRLLLRFKWVLLAAPLVAACLIYFALRGRPEEYTTTSVIYTGLVSGFNLESGGDSKLDYHVVNSGFDNLITTIQSRETLVTVAMELLSGMACGTSQYPLLEADASVTRVSDFLKASRDQSRQADSIADSSSIPVTGCASDSDWIESEVASGKGVLYETLFQGSGSLSLSSLGSHLSVKRINSSDLLEVAFTAPDPTFAHDFLTILNTSFIDRYQRIKRKEVGSVVAFFEAETARSYERLQLSVDRMREFGTVNRVINYYEQTKAIAGQKELIDQQIQQETMRLQSAESAARDLEERIGASEEIRQRGQELVDLRQRFAEVTARSVVGTRSESVTSNAVEAIPALTRQIEQSVAALYDARYSKEGLVKTEIIERWMEEMVVIAQSKASLTVLEDRKREYIKVYDEFAPLGSTLNTLEREVDVAENEYLELLHSLNQARMRQQNIELSSSMDVFDPPSFPHDPVASKLMLLMMASSLVTLLLGVGAVTAMELLDESLRSPDEAARKTGMDVVGFVPDLSSRGVSQSPLENPDVRRSVEVMAARIKTVIAKHPDRDTHLICLASANHGDGKTQVASLLETVLSDSGRHVIRLTPGLTYSVNAGYAGSRAIGDIMHLPEGEQVVILMELPALTTNEIPVSLLQTADLVLWIAKAESLWTSLEQSTLQFSKEQAGIEPMLCLNAVQWERLESSLGEISKKRSSLRKAAKRLLQRNFS